MFSTQGKLYTLVLEACESLPFLFTPLLSAFLGNPFSPPEKHELQGVNVTLGRTALAVLADPVGCSATVAPVKLLKEETPVRGISRYIEQWVKWDPGLGTAPYPGFPLRN